MASAGSIQKAGVTSWKLTVSGGFDGAGKRVRHTKTVHCTSETQAKKELALFVSEIERGEISTSGKMTLDEYFDYWKKNHATKNLASTTLVTYEHIFKRISQALGHKRIDKIEPIHLNSLFANLQEPIKVTSSGEPEMLSIATIKKHHELLSIMFNRAVKWNLIPYNPITRIEIPKQKRKPKKIYNQEELGKFLILLEEEPIKYQLMVNLALTGSLRREEIFGLEWSHIDLENNTVQINQAAVYIPGQPILLKDTKTTSSNRLISISESVNALIKRHKVEQSTQELKLGDKWITDDEHNFVFTTWNGTISHPHSVNNWLKKFIVKNDLPHVSIHDFRHMNASYLIIAGTDIRTIAGKLGHSKASFTMDTYAHLIKSAEKETANVMDILLKQITEKEKIAQKKQAK